jgi:vanillate/3-O-methylgallate O-demethylase
MKRQVGQASLQLLIDKTPDLVEFFRNDTLAPHAKHRAELTPIPVDETNWRDEQRAWRETAILFNQSFHMPELFVRGKDAFRLLNYVGINSFENFDPGRAKSLLGCSPDGHVIGECILHRHAADEFELTSGQYLQNWVQFVAETGGFEVTVERDPAMWDNPTRRRANFRFQLDGPAAAAIFAETVEGAVPEIPFFRTARVKIAGKFVFVLRHGMAGHNGVELSGAFDDGAAVRAALLAAGKKHGLLSGGTRAYFSTNGEEGWLPYPLSGIYVSEELRAFREWLSIESWEAKAQLGGSFVSTDIRDYYVTPWDLNLARLMKFDHEFVGREALEKRAKGPHRTKVTLVWDNDDVGRINGSMYGSDLPYKYIDMPTAHYSFQHADEVRDKNGRLIGLSMWCGYSANERRMLSLAVINEADARIGGEVSIVWGEPNGGTRKPHVERHRQTEVRATIGPAPYGAAMREQLHRATRVRGK